MAYYLTRFDTSIIELDIWKMTSPGHVIHHKRLWGHEDTYLGMSPIYPITDIDEHIIAQSDNLEQLIEKAVMESLETPNQTCICRLFLNDDIAESLNRSSNNFSVFRSSY